MKHETIEEAAEKEFPLLNTQWCKTGAAEEENLQLLGHRKSFIKGARWQAKRMISQEAQPKPNPRGAASDQLHKPTNKQTVMSKLHLDYETEQATVEIEAEYTLNVISELQDGASSLSIKIKISELNVIRAYDDNDNKLTEQEVNRLMFKHQHDIMSLAQMQILEGLIK